MFKCWRFPVLVALALAAIQCGCDSKQQQSTKHSRMIEQQIELRGIKEPPILNAFSSVPREAFVPPKYRPRAYDDIEIPFASGQTLDRPYVNALMIQALELKPSDRVLEVGTGSGYFTALMSKMVDHVYSIDIEPAVAEAARERLKALGFNNIDVLTGDGFLGWPDHAPFDAIVLSCSPPKIPKPLEDQLAEGGFLLLPIGGKERFQELILYRKQNGKLVESQHVAPASFTPMTGKALEK